MVVGEIGSGGKHDVSRDAEARNTLSWPAWNKRFYVGVGSINGRASLRREHTFTLEDPLKCLSFCARL